MKKTINLLLCLILSVVMAIPMVSCGETETQATSFVSLDINPEIELTLDASNKVLSVYGANEDGKVLLFDETDLVGKSLDEVVAKITDLAVELGYLTEDNKVVATSVTSAIQGKAEEIEKALSSKISATAKNLGLNVSVDSEAVFSVLRKLEEYKAKNPDNQLIQGLSVEKFKLALSASETGEVSLDVAVTLDDSALIEKISSVHKEVEAFATDAYNKVKAEALSIYDKAVGAILDSAYSTFYLTKMTEYLDSFWYGYAYQTYKTMARGFDGLSKLMVCVEKSSSYPIDETTVTAVLNALDMDASQIDNLKDSDGNITLNSIEAYADVLFKNAPDGVDLAEIQSQLKSVLRTVDSQVLATVKAEIAKFEPQIEQIADSVKTVISAVKTSATIIPENLKQGLNSFISDVESIVTTLLADVESGNVNAEKLTEYAKTALTKANETLQKIEADLSEEDLATVTAQIAKLEETLSSAKKNMEDALALAEKTAKDKISALKESRKSK